ncbi:MAG: hypothetical protein ACRDKE_05460 [Solirubrobacterales bacterium]
MDWRLPIEQQKPVSPSAAERPSDRPASFIDSDEYRRAARDPDLVALAIQARSYRENLRREGRRA